VGLGDSVTGLAEDLVAAICIYVEQSLVTESC
jgi:hypothetical protein